MPLSHKADAMLDTFVRELWPEGGANNCMAPRGLHGLFLLSGFFSSSLKSDTLLIRYWASKEKKKGNKIFSLILYLPYHVPEMNI